jgi:hypothetical protein
MKKYNVQLLCGCCEAELAFENEDAIKKAFGETMKDDEGKIVEDIDIFYGYREINENFNVEEGKLERLFNQIKNLKE